jgi:hypothetical protein
METLTSVEIGDGAASLEEAHKGKPIGTYLVFEHAMIRRYGFVCMIGFSIRKDKGCPCENRTRWEAIRNALGFLYAPALSQRQHQIAAEQANQRTAVDVEMASYSLR